jgi:post-segregation antitoxin (ccd killing protein)
LYDHTMPAARVTVTLPPDLVEEIDRRERNRSRFVLEAVRREIRRRRREELRRSLEHPHAEAEELADAGLEDWGTGSRREETSELLGPGAGKLVRWVPGKGWLERKR